MEMLLLFKYCSRWGAMFWSALVKIIRPTDSSGEEKAVLTCRGKSAFSSNNRTAWMNEYCFIFMTKSMMLPPSLIPKSYHKLALKSTLKLGVRSSRNGLLYIAYELYIFAGKIPCSDR